MDVEIDEQMLYLVEKSDEWIEGFWFAASNAQVRFFERLLWRFCLAATANVDNRSSSASSNVLDFQSRMPATRTRTDLSQDEKLRFDLMRLLRVAQADPDWVGRARFERLSLELAWVKRAFEHHKID